MLYINITVQLTANAQVQPQAGRQGIGTAYNNVHSRAAKEKGVAAGAKKVWLKCGCKAGGD
jgi:hypothetical protein